MKKYVKPQVIVEEFKTEEVITTSTGRPSTGGDNETPFEPVS